ncbi:uncharacterized protein BXZ73DRAFT_102533 [Epithele typhae]|uniref:uncharacterized protein n=1 Tax=Epithele typhae TaxID=378194 RepID=UPI0020087549|nr:uncharacterized protein BXZ73DRAFT_102533 [Epithele typhae]KAH9928028.1 hypothetical protein BXZ73DRAFT_102533 [Epithele typhae]
MASIRDVLGHASVLPRHDFAYGPGNTAANIVGRIRVFRSAYELREKWSYNNQMYMPGARLVAQYSGMSCADFLPTRIFGRLHMDDTTIWPSVAQRSGKLVEPDALPGEFYLRLLQGPPLGLPFARKPAFRSVWATHVRMEYTDGNAFDTTFTAIFPAGYGRNSSAFEFSETGESGGPVEFDVRDGEVVGFSLITDWAAVERRFGEGAGAREVADALFERVD